MQPSTVVLKGGRPASLTFKRRTYAIAEIADHWSEHGRWWEGEPVREFFLVNAQSGSFLLCLDAQEKQWYVKPVQ